MTSTPPSDPGPQPTRTQVDWDAEEESVERGRRSAPPNRRWWLIGAVAVLVMSAMAVVWGVSATVGRVHWVYTGHEVVSDTQVDVRFDLRRDPARPVVCRIEAQDGSHAVVGRAEVDVEATESSPSRHVAAVRTASPAITGYVDECWYADEEPRH